MLALVDAHLVAAGRMKGSILPGEIDVFCKNSRKIMASNVRLFLSEKDQRVLVRTEFMSTFVSFEEYVYHPRPMHFVRAPLIRGSIVSVSSRSWTGAPGTEAFSIHGTAREW